MIRAVFVLSCLVVIACGGEGDPDPDPGAPDAGAEGPDADPAAVCTGAVYDSCVDTTSSSDCDDGMMCHAFDQAGITVCVPACDVSNPCPQQDGVDVRCNNMGRCRPDVASDCTLP
jgi:hypothetical protein